MKRDASPFFSRLLVASCALLCGCGAAVGKPDTSLDRVVVYRNGVAYFERSAHVEGEELTVRVRSDDVDDFLKSLSVLDAQTRASLPVEYPSGGAATSYGVVDMKLRLSGAAPHDVTLSYVTEAPAWKPTYRAVLGDKGKLTLEGWAIVDNASGEDWKGVKLAVAASAAMSFRFDLKTVRFMQRERFDAGPLLAPAPPPGGVPYGGSGAKTPYAYEVSADVLDASIPPAEKLQWAREEIPRMEKRRDQIVHVLGLARAQRDVVKVLCINDKLSQTVVALTSARDHLTLLEGALDRDDNAEITHQATILRELSRRSQALSAESSQCVGEEAAFVGGTTVATIVDPDLPDEDEESGGRARPPLGPASATTASPSPPEQLLPQVPRVTTPAPPPAPRKPSDLTFSTEPVGSGHFEASARTTIASGSSAMVSVFKQEAEGELVYLYDRESARGNEAYAFLALRFQNPTAEALEGGPFTVLGKGRLLGEGIAESIPGGGAAFVPFALDRQIVVARTVDEKDEIARVVLVRHGMVSAEMTHVRAERLTLQNRLAEAATVYVRHTSPKGAALREAPKSREKLGAAELFRVEVPAHGEIEVAIDEATASAKSFDPTSREGAALVRAYVASPSADPATKAMLGKLLASSEALDGLDAQIREAIAARGALEERKAELEKQIAALRGGPSGAKALRGELEKKLGDANARLLAAAMDLVTLGEKRLAAKLARDETFRLAEAPAKGGASGGAAAAARAPAP